MKVNFYDSTREYHNRKAEIDAAINHVVETGSFILGNTVSSFEDEVCKFTGAKYAIGVASGTDALVMTSDMLGFKDGAEIITSPFTFLASTSCIAKHKGVPVFVDIDEETFNINENLIEDKITNKTKGIVPIHLFSQMCNMDKIMDIANTHNLKVLEDAAEAFGMRWAGDSNELRHSGTIGDFGVFSFFPTKTLGGYGDGGMIVTNSEELYNLTKIYRVHGASKKYHYDYIGYNSRLDAMQAAVLSVKLKYMHEAIENRARIANWYKERLKDIPEVSIPSVKGNQKGVYYVFNILCERRNELVDFLKKNEIGTSIYYPVPLHLQKCFSYLGYKKGDFPVAEKLCDKVLALPIYPELTEDEVNFVCEKIKEFYRK